MDAGHFDSLARMLTASPSRRTALSLLVAGALSPLLGLAAEAKKKRKNKHKKKKRFCKCATPSGKVCKKGRCVCPTGEEVSGGVCGMRPTCVGGSEPCAEIGGGEDCCSGVCLVGFCVNSPDGEPCYTSEQCSNPASECRGFVCVAP